jgi:hypothetical protein
VIVTKTAALKTGSAGIYSVLQVLYERRTKTALSIPKDTVAVSRAALMVQECGLPLVASPSAAALVGDISYKAGTTYLKIINDLLQYAGFDSAEVDGYGNVLFVPYTDPASLSPVITFQDGLNCVFMEPVSHELNILDVPNVVIAVWSSTDGYLEAVAINDSPDNRYSTISRGREIPHLEEVSEIESQAALDALAARVLREKTSAVESVVIRHVDQRFEMGQAARLIYAKADTDFTGVAVTKDLTLSLGIPCETRFRRFVRF